MMDGQSVCRCCLSEGLHKDLDSIYSFMDQKEVYTNMLQECFNIILSPKPEVQSGICEWCVGHLRDSCNFKRQVLKSEQEFIMKLEQMCHPDAKVQVKVEMKYESSADDSDDYFLADTVRQKSPSVKMEDTDLPKAKCKNATKKRTSTLSNRKNGPQTDNLRSLVDKLGTSIKNGDAITIPDKRQRPRNSKLITKSPNTASALHGSDIHNDLEKKSITLGQKKILLGKEITISKRKSSAEKPKVSWKSTTAKEKHVHNLHTILSFSNAMVFKNKDLLGYICGYCEQAFQDPADLRVHTQRDHKKERMVRRSPYDMSSDTVKLDIHDLQCTLCDQNMDNLFTLKDHLVTFHNKTIYSDIKDHIVQYKLTKGDVYDCVLCPNTYETFKMLKQHMNTHYSNYVCPTCNTAFATTRSLSSHKKIHIEGSFKCDRCDKVFANTTKKQYHEKMAHLGARNISNCVYCNQPFRSYYQRNQHMIRVHNAQAQYKCNICDKEYILKSLLMNHIKKNHLMEKNCQCTECGHRFFSKKALKAHMVKHTGERNFACAVCHKCFARKFTLTEHMRIHNNDRRFKCTICELSFVQKCSLKSHLLSNHGISMAASEITTVGV